MARTTEEILAELRGAPAVTPEIPIAKPQRTQGRSNEEILGTLRTQTLEPTEGIPEIPIIERADESRTSRQLQEQHRRAIRAEQQRILANANQSMEPETIRQMAEDNVASDFSGRIPGFELEQPVVEPAAPIDLPTVGESRSTWEMMGQAARPQQRVGSTRQERMSEVDSRPSYIRVPEMMEGLLSVEDYAAQEGVTRQDKTEYEGFRSAVGQYLRDNPAAGLQVAISGVQSELGELPALAAGEADPERYYESSQAGEMGPNDPVYRAFARARTEGAPMPRLTDVQKTYLQSALAARQKEFYPDIDAAIGS